MRASFRSVLGAVGIKQKEKRSQNGHWFDEYNIEEFWGSPFNLYYVSGEPHGMEAWYVVELRVMRQRLPKKEPPKMCREYLVATVAKSATRDPTGNGFLVFDRSKDRRPAKGWDPSGAHPDRTRECDTFEEKKAFEASYTDADFEKYLNFPSKPRLRYMHVDRVRILAKPYLYETDETVAILRLEPPEPNGTIPDSPPSTSAPSTNTTPSTSTTPANTPFGDVTPTNASQSTITQLPTPYFPVGVVPKLPTLYVWELVFIAVMLNRSKELYYIFPETVHWLPGMMIHICRAWTGATLELRHGDGKRSAEVPASQEILDWWNQQQQIMEHQKSKDRGKEDYSDVIRIIKTPKNNTINALVEFYWELGNEFDVLEMFQEIEEEERLFHHQLDAESWAEVERFHQQSLIEMDRITAKKAAEFKKGYDERKRKKALLEAREKKVRLQEGKVRQANEKEPKMKSWTGDKRQGTSSRSSTEKKSRSVSWESQEEKILQSKKAKSGPSAPRQGEVSDAGSSSSDRQRLVRREGGALRAEKRAEKGSVFSRGLGPIPEERGPKEESSTTRVSKEGISRALEPKEEPPAGTAKGKSKASRFSSLLRKGD